MQDQHEVEAALAVLADQCRFAMLSKLEENAARTDVQSKERIYAVAALRLCRESWDEFLSQWKSDLPMNADCNAEKQLASMVRMNQTLRAKLKDASLICRNIYAAVIGPVPIHLRSGDKIVNELNEEVQRLREDLFVNQHGLGGKNSGIDEFALGTDGDVASLAESQAASQAKLKDTDFSFRDFLELADFKMSHAAKQIFDLETRRYSEYSGSAIDWELRLKDVTQDLQKQVRRLTRSLSQEKLASSVVVRQMQDEHSGQLAAKDRKFDEMVERLTDDKNHMKASLEARIAVISGEFDERLRELSLTFLQKLGDVRDATEESKHMAARALQSAIVSLKERIRAEAEADGALSKEVIKKAVAAEELIDVHQPWDGADRDTLLRLLRGRIQEQEILASAQHASLRARTMEWETALREIVAKYEDELRRLGDKAAQAEDLLLQSNKSVEIKSSEIAELKWSQAQYREEVKGWTATTLDAHNQRVDSLNVIVNDLEAKVVDLKQQLDKSQETLLDTQKMHSHAEEELSKERSRREDLEALRVVAEQFTQTDGTSRKFSMSLDSSEPSQSRQSSARRDNNNNNNDDDSGSHLSRVSSARRGTVTKYLRTSKSIRKTNQGSPDSPQDEPAGLLPSEKSLSSATKSLKRLKDKERMVNAFFLDKGGEEASKGGKDDEARASPKLAQLGRPRDLVKQQRAQVIDPGAPLDEPSLDGTVGSLVGSVGRRGSMFAQRMEERRASLSASTTANSELAKLHGITPEKLQMLLTPDPADEKKLLEPTGPVDGSDPIPAVHSNDDFATEFMHRCVSEVSFFRLLIKLIMFLEFAASPPNQHTMSPMIKKLLLIRPSLAAQIQALRDIRPVEGLDVTCLNQYLEEYVAQSLLNSSVPRSDDRHALSMISRFTQHVVDLRIERCVQAVGIPLMVGYIPGEAPAPVNDPSGLWRRRMMKAAECKPLVELALDVMGYMEHRSKSLPVHRKANFAATVEATRSASPRDGGSGAHFPDIAPSANAAGIRSPRKPITVSSVRLDKQQQRRSSHHVQQLVDAVDVLRDTQEVSYTCQEHVRRQSVAVAVTPNEPDPVAPLADDP